MRLSYFAANAAWGFVFGDAPLALDCEPLFFDKRKEAVAAAGRKGLSVARDGQVSVAP